VPAKRRGHPLFRSRTTRSSITRRPGRSSRECGLAEPPKDGGGEWHLLARVGGHSEDLIRVDKRSGAVSYGSEPPMAAEDLIRLERHRLKENLQTFVREGPGQ